jgi:hypothetical protein
MSLRVAGRSVMRNVNLRSIEPKDNQPIRAFEKGGKCLSAGARKAHLPPIVLQPIGLQRGSANRNVRRPSAVHIGE